VEEIQAEEGGAKFISPLPSYILPRKPNAKSLKNAKNVKYGKFTPLFPKDVPFEGETLRKILQLKFTNNDFNYQTKYLQFIPDRYLQQVHYPDCIVTRLEPQWWENGLEQSRLLKMLNATHFGRSFANTTCVRKLLVLIHDGHLWTRNKIPIDQVLIWRNIGLPYRGWNPVEEFVGKDKDHAVVENMKKTYGLVKGNRGYNINLISDQAVQFVAHIFAGKIMRKCCANEVPSSIVSFVA